MWITLRRLLTRLFGRRRSCSVMGFGGGHGNGKSRLESGEVAREDRQKDPTFSPNALLFSYTDPSVATPETSSRIKTLLTQTSKHLIRARCRRSITQLPSHRTSNSPQSVSAFLTSFVRVNGTCMSIKKRLRKMTDRLDVIVADRFAIRFKVSFRQTSIPDHE
jgi:hypothetical protein